MTDQTSSHTALTPKTAKKVSVGITAIELQGAPWFDYSMNANYHDKGGKQDHDTLIFDKNAGNFDIEFFLSDVPPGLMFRPTFAEAFGIAPSPTCPAVGATVAGFDGRVSKDQSTLFLTNKNGGIGGSFQFALCFDGPYRDASHPPFPWDPKILNGGTGTFTDAVKIGIALAAVAIGAALFVAFR
jgi:hypothetical protein